MALTTTILLVFYLSSLVVSIEYEQEWIDVYQYSDDEYVYNCGDIIRNSRVSVPLESDFEQRADFIEAQKVYGYKMVCLRCLCIKDYYTREWCERRNCPNIHSPLPNDN